MKTGVLLVIFIILWDVTGAQDPDSLKSVRRTHFELIAGPTFFRSENPYVLPSIKYQFGVIAIHRLKRGFVQAGLQYLPIAATFQDGDNYFKFSNHVLAALLLGKLPVTPNKRLTIDLGMSYGLSVAHLDNYPPNVDCTDPDALPMRTKNYFLFQAGASWRMSDRYTIGALNGFGLPMKSWHSFVHMAPSHGNYYMLQAWLGYRI
jgi:hypothetical protein